ncbi:MAG TPA: hemerythrin domain-containing protein [Brevundimonas sp.]|uniref:hemerythrin domain-containing protein n=1 Tax=Brevundimonas sp. TaxID=1871086 RepID=UPI002619E62C|nr:hemerythrin domain-containing protein [Brevundimonas sp.]HRO32094.1 hemerythrin domain-containing protein [Brevundimonas sp.]
MTRERHIEPMPVTLMHEPLEWLFAEHYRHRQLCALIERVATATVPLRDEIAEILDFLRFELPLHVIDEEEDLFPLLRRRALPEDELDKILGVLSADHKADMVNAAQLRALLETAQQTGVPPGGQPDNRRLMTAFASGERRHIALENAVILPIARLRLRPEDLRNLALRLAARRGVVLPPLAANGPSPAVPAAS